MNHFPAFTSRIVHVPANDIDTDQIIPARYLKVTDKLGLAEGLFADWRYAPDGTLAADFPLNHPASRGAMVLLAGNNFGCGSSREHAPWALAAFGFKAIISTSFADIFRNNALKNDLLPVVVDPSVHASLTRHVTADPAVEVTVDLASQTLRIGDGPPTHFPVDSFAKKTLLEGLDELGYLRSFEARTLEYEARRGITSLTAAEGA